MDTIEKCFEFAKKVEEKLREELDIHIVDDIGTGNPAIEFRNTAFSIECDFESGTFDVWVATTIPGCHTMPNGDPGYPDDVDVDVAWSCKDFVEAIESILLKIRELQITDAIQCIGEDEWDNNMRGWESPYRGVGDDD